MGLKHTQSHQFYLVKIPQILTLSGSEIDIDPKNTGSGRIRNRAFYPIRSYYRRPTDLRTDPNRKPKTEEIKKLKRLKYYKETGKKT